MLNVHDILSLGIRVLKRWVKHCIITENGQFGVSKIFIQEINLIYKRFLFLNKCFTFFLLIKEC